MMFYKAIHKKVVRLFLVTAVLVILIGTPTTPPVFAGDCPTSASGNCG